MATSAKAAAEAKQARKMKYITIPVNGQDYEFRVPTTAQFLIFAGRIREVGDDPTTLMPAVEKFLKRTAADEATFDEIWELLENGDVDIDEIVLNDDSVLMTMGEQLGGSPSGESGASSARSTATGKRSTGRSPGKGSTRSS